jgi:multicomponent Na+:H+ antiporter subunit D
MTYIPVLSEGQKDSKSGPLRFLIFQTFALPLVIFSGILLSGIDTAPAESPIIIQATILLMLGFTFWLGIFPFHSWLPMISTTSKPWIVSFLLISMPTIYIFFLLTFFDRYAWLRTIPMVNNAILFIGILMIVTAGVLIALENHLSKVLGYSIILDNGFSLLTIGLMADGGLPWLSYMIIPRVIAYFLWGFSLTILSEKYESLTFEKTQGLLYSSPITFIGIFIAQMSLAGLPLLASFPAKQLIWLSVTEKNSIQGLLVILGNFGLIIFSLRLLSNSLTLKDENQDKTWQLDPVKFIIPISICILVLFLIGIFPHFFLKDSPSLLNSFNIIFNK